MICTTGIRIKIQTSDFEVFEINNKFYNLSSKVRFLLEEKERRKIYMRERIAAAKQKEAAEKLKADAAAAENNVVASDEVQTLKGEQNETNATTSEEAETNITPSAANEAAILEKITIATNAVVAETLKNALKALKAEKASIAEAKSQNLANTDNAGNKENEESTANIEEKNTKKMDTKGPELIPTVNEKNSVSDSSDESDFEDDEIYDGTLFLANINASTFLKVLEWVHHYKEEDDLAATQIEMENRLLALRAKKCYVEHLPPWEQQFLRMSKQRLYELALAADFLDLKKLRKLACKPVLKKISKLMKKESEDNSNAPVVI